MGRARVIATLDPACFSIVMATGVVSLACWHHGLETWLHGLSTMLLWGNVLAFVLLTGLTICRLFLHPTRMMDDFQNTKRSFGFFSIVAASCVLGSQFQVTSQMPRTAIGLWCFGIVTWFLLTYGIFFSVTVQQRKASIRNGLHGGWLLAVVAAQSVSVLGAMLSVHFTTGRDAVLFFSLTMWLRIER